MTKNASKSFPDRLKSFIASEQCFWLIVVFFACEALWIALSGLYPMAFDENFHLGIIKLYAGHASPFWNSPPPDSSAFGAVARDPSYLYQWLMSFPYRLISALTDSQTAQVILLRLINIGLFAAGLPLYRRLLLKTGASRLIVHLCLALFVMIPIAPLLAAQINYDNLFIPLVAAGLLLAVNFCQKLPRELDIRALLGLAVICALGSLVKYAFLPIALAIMVYLIIRIWQNYRGRSAELLKALEAGWRAASGRTKWLLVILLIVAGGLFLQRYAVNLARYHKPVPGCDEVLSVQQCKAYSPWYRDYKYAHQMPANVQTSPLIFSADWFYGMWFRTFFAVDGPGTGFATRGPLYLPAVGAIVFSVTALLATAVRFRRVLKRYNGAVLWLLIGVTAVYAAALWADGYQSFLQTGRPVALNGRYLLAVYPLLIVILACGLNVYLGSRERVKAGAAALALICMFWGGGTLTYVLRSSDNWYWPDTPLKSANHTVQDVIGPLVPGNADPKAFMGRHGT